LILFDLFHSWFDKALLSVVEGLTTNGINQRCLTFLFIALPANARCFMLWGGKTP
jgi:hypothetical protein